MTDRPNDLETATLAGGCFWCLEAVFEQVRGVEAVVSGYSGGHVHDPSYEAVCSGSTGHAEVVQLSFDPMEIGFRELLEIFFSIHDPTTPNRQGNDVGTQYRSAVFYHSADQKRVVEEVIRQLESEGVWDSPIVTEVSPFERFYAAEAYHREYFRRNPAQAYCQVVVAPKVSRFRERFRARLRG